MVPRLPHDVLARGRDVLDPALRSAVRTLPEGVRRVAAFHFGWCDQSGYRTDGAGVAGRALLSAEAADVPLPAALAVELVHNFFLLHDEVSGDGVAGPQPTARSLFGAGPVVLAGAALQTLAFTTLAGSGSPRARAAMRVLSATVRDLLEDQLAGERARSEALLECASALGDLLANAGERAAAA